LLRTGTGGRGATADRSFGVQNDGFLAEVVTEGHEVSTGSTTYVLPISGSGEWRERSDLK